MVVTLRSLRRMSPRVAHSVDGGIRALKKEPGQTLILRMRSILSSTWRVLSDWKNMMRVASQKT